MRTLILIAAAGLAAQLIDGSLGMGYGVTTTTLLLALGTTPVAASATVHLAEIGTTMVAGFSHWRFGNVDWKVVLRMGIPGALGAFAGATVLAWLDTAIAGPLMAGVLIILGGYVLVRFALRGLRPVRTGRALPWRFLAPLGVVAGFLDATGGGGWGAVGTPALLASGRIEPRRTVGSIDTSEAFVALAASAGFLVSLGSQGINFAWAGALLAGGIVAAPVAAWLVRILPTRILGTVAGGMIMITNARTLLHIDQIEAATSAARWPVFVILTTITLAAVGWAIHQHRQEPPVVETEMPDVREGQTVSG